MAQGSESNQNQSPNVNLVCLHDFAILHNLELGEFFL